jgi:hypothetical protein
MGVEMDGGFPRRKEILAQLDARYLGEYVRFSGQIREYVSDTLSRAYKADPNPIRRDHHVVSLVQLEYAAYEDAAALLKSLIAFRLGKSPTVLEVLESYAPGQAVLARVFSDVGLTEAAALYDALRFDEALPLQWSEWFPSLDLKKALLLGCTFFMKDCADNQKDLGIASYNKAKHGPLVVARGDLFAPTFQPVPSMLLRNRWPEKYGAEPFIVYGFPLDEAKIEERERLVHFVQRTLRLFVVVLFQHAYPDEPKRRWRSAEAMWHESFLRDVLELIDEITRKK